MAVYAVVKATIVWQMRYAGIQSHELLALALCQLPTSTAPKVDVHISRFTLIRSVVSHNLAGSAGLQRVMGC
jgi:hypothetical protein